jgi:LPXTG-motif cell wall-anchored protein
VSGIILGLNAALADVALEPVRTSGSDQTGMIMAGLAFAAAVAALGVVFVRRRGRNNRG